MTNIQIRTEEDVLAVILTLFPQARMLSDDEGQLIISTGCMWSGKNGTAIIGDMYIDGDEPEWEDS